MKDGFFDVFDPINSPIDNGYAVFYGCYQFRVWVWITPDSSLDVVSWQPTHIVVLEFYLECNYVSRAIPVPSTHSQHEKCALQQFHAVSAVTRFDSPLFDGIFIQKHLAGRQVPTKTAVRSDGIGGGSDSTRAMLKVPESRHFDRYCVDSYSNCNLTKTAARRHLLFEI